MTNETLVFFHTHPFTDSPVFSAVDSQGERVLRHFLARRTVHCHYALVLGREGAQARELGSQSLIAVRIVGPTVSFILPEREDGSAVDPKMDRQVRAFGLKAQQRLESLRVAIVGLGGTGSLTAEWLAHLGVSNFLLLDPDTLVASNLNRVVGATPKNLGDAILLALAGYDPERIPRKLHRPAVRVVWCYAHGLFNRRLVARAANLSTKTVARTLAAMRVARTATSAFEGRCEAGTMGP